MDRINTLKDKKTIVFGERDDISGNSVSTCLRAASATVIYEATACFVWTAAGAVSLAEQDAVKKLADEHGKENLLIVFGINQIPTLRIMAQTFKRGDPSFSGALAGIELGILSYHIFEIKDLIPADVWEKEMAMHELELEEESQQAICQTMAKIRQG